MKFRKKIATGRLVLRPVTWRDFGFFCRLNSDADVRRYLGGPVPWRDLYARFVPLLADGAYWLVQMKSGRRVGLITIGPHKDGMDYELSYQFYPRFWGRGVAIEAGHAVLSDIDLPRIIAETQSANVASCRLLERLGFVEHQRLQRFGAEQVIYVKEC